MNQLNEYFKESGYTEKDFTNRICNKCGSQVLKEKFIPCRDPEDEWTPKNTCNGTGILNGKTCEYCNGTGQYYPYVCPNCDENMFTFETTEIKK